MRNLIPILLLSIFFGACNRQTIEPLPTDLGMDYVSLESGHYIIYEVDSIVYNDFTQTVDTTHLQFKDEVGESFIDNEGRTAYIVNRTKRYNNADPWSADHTYSIFQDNFKFEWQENNLRFIKMVYPAKFNTRWYGNVYIASLTNSNLSWLNDWEYEYENIDESFNTGYKNYQKTVVVSQLDSLDGIEGNPLDPNSYSAYSYGREVYAKNVGMIFKEITRWEYQTTAKFRKGFTIIMRAKSNN